MKRKPLLGAFGLITTGVAAALLFGGCASVPEPPPLDLATLKNLSYYGIYNDPVTLSNGRYEGQSFVPGGATRPRVQFAEQLYIIGDLDGDTSNEAAGFLTESTGGSGSYTYLVIVDTDNGQYKNVATHILGDRIMVRALRFEQGRLELDMVMAGPGDAACCPSMKVHKTYRYAAGTVAEIRSTETGPLSVADLAGNWSLTHLARDVPLPATVKVDIAFKQNGFSGLAGCNRYFGSVKGKGPRQLAFGSIGATRMMCAEPVMQVEDRYLQALHSVQHFSFMYGQLALGYQDAKGWHTLLFKPQQD